MRTSTGRFTDRERIDWLRLIRTENIGPITFHQLLRRFGSARTALAALPELSRRGGRFRPLAAYPLAEAEAEIEAHRERGIELIATVEGGYPPMLATLDDAPPLISLRGRPELLARTMVAMVGARNASANGIRFARQLAVELGAAGLVVVSGMARGIDAAAHAGALSTGTVAVLAGGANVVYPAENATLYERLIEDGAIVSEMPLGLVAQARHFPRRNRLISGMALGVVVVEASLRSGSLITARFALEQGREVFAVPGSPLDPRCRGSNDLIRQGANLTESAADILANLPSQPSVVAETAASEPSHEPPLDLAVDADLAAARRQVAEKLGPSPVPVDEIIRQCQLSAPVVLTILLELELAGRLSRHPGNQVSFQS